MSFTMESHKATAGNTENKEGQRIGPDSPGIEDKPASISVEDNSPFDLASFITQLEKQNTEMTDDEARCRLLYELSFS
jgi:hypothetical protein